MSALFRRVVQIGLVAVVSASPAAAQTTTATFSANVGGIAKVKTRATPGSTVRLTILATDNLRSGVNTIPATALTWTTTGAGYVGGTVNSFAAQTLGSWLDSGINVGTQNYLFQNSWNYVPGTYNVVLMYTLAAP
jgi:hypothetical protein